MTSKELEELANNILSQTGEGRIASASWLRVYASLLAKGVLELLDDIKQDAMDRNLAD